MALIAERGGEGSSIQRLISSINLAAWPIASSPSSFLRRSTHIDRDRRTRRRPRIWENKRSYFRERLVHRELEGPP